MMTTWKYVLRDNDCALQRALETFELPMAVLCWGQGGLCPAPASAVSGLSGYLVLESGVLAFLQSSHKAFSGWQYTPVGGPVATFAIMLLAGRVSEYHRPLRSIAQAVEHMHMFAVLADGSSSWLEPAWKVDGKSSLDNSVSM